MAGEWAGRSRWGGAVRGGGPQALGGPRPRQLKGVGGGVGREKGTEVTAFLGCHEGGHMCLKHLGWYKTIGNSSLLPLTLEMA